jgi:hypothetical protein
VQVQVLLQEVGKLRGIALGADNANGFVRVNGLGKSPKMRQKTTKNTKNYIETHEK